jgi:hypothetical protein
MSNKDYPEALKKGVKENLHSDSEENIEEIILEQECFFLWSVLVTYCFQRKFANYGNEKVKLILDEVHNLIDAKLNTKQTKELSGKYNKYYKAMKDDWESMEKNIGELLFYSLTFAFVGNLVDRELSQTEFPRTRIMLGVTIAEINKALFDIFERMLEQLKDYEVVFKY